MNKWTATSLVLLIAILCGAIHGAVVREQQQPLDAALQQAPDHSNGTERTDTDNAEPEKPEPNPEKSEPEKPEPNPEKPEPNPEKSEPEKPGPNPEKPEPNPEKPESEKPEPNPEKSEPDQSELYPAELDESEGEQARMKRDNNKTKTNPKPVEPPKPVNANTSKPVEPVNANTSKPVEPHKPPKPVNATTSKNETEPEKTEEPGPVVDTNSTEPTPPSNTTGPLNPTDTNKTDTSNYEPKDDPNVNRKYTANLFYWEPESKKCYRKADASAEENPKTDEELTLGKIPVINKTAVAGAAPKTDSGNDELFNKWSECAKIQFYGELGLDDAKSYFGNATAAPEEEFSDLQAFHKFGFMQDMVLLLLDGRVVCPGAKEKDAVTVTLSIVQDLDAGLIPTLCPAIKEHEYGQKMLTITESSPFVFGVLLSERLCPHNKVPGKAPDVPGDLVIEKLKYKYEKVNLVVKHSCMGENTVNIALPTIDVFEMNEVDRVLQIRDLELNLTALMDNMKLEKGNKMADVSGFYFNASIGVDSGTDKNKTAEVNPEVKMQETAQGEIIAIESDDMD